MATLMFQFPMKIYLSVCIACNKICHGHLKCWFLERQSLSHKKVSTKEAHKQKSIVEVRDASRDEVVKDKSK